MSELFGAIVMWVQARGKSAGAMALFGGLLLLPIGYWLTFIMPGPDYWSPIMLVVPVMGLAIMGVGASAFFGANARMAEALEQGAEIVEEELVELDLRAPEAAHELPLPFWACGDCRVTGPGSSISGGCVRCGKAVSFVEVESERERGMALAVLGQPSLRS